MDAPEREFDEQTSKKLAKIEARQQKLEAAAEKAGDAVDRRQVEAVCTQRNLQPRDLRVATCMCGRRRGEREGSQDDPETAHQGGIFCPARAVPSTVSRSGCRRTAPSARHATAAAAPT